MLLALVLGAPGAEAQETDQDIERLLAATSEVRLAYVITGDTRLDDTSEAGLRGLSEVLFRRTSIEPVEPVGVNLETDELSVYPFLYWPISENQPRPSSDAYARLNRYLRTGGMILFDTRDADVAQFGGSVLDVARPSIGMYEHAMSPALFVRDVVDDEHDLRIEGKVRGEVHCKKTNISEEYPSLSCRVSKTWSKADSEEAKSSASSAGR